MEKYLTGFELEFLVKLGLALFGGLVIGLEREAKGKIAGISTHSLVIAGAMLFTFISFEMSESNPARIAAQVVSGIGFLGGGIIFKGEGGVLANVTTAASIWFSAAIGMAIGFGWYAIAIIAILYAAIIPRLPNIRETRDTTEADA
jgi:putative Mg2+ transporter-C (MgtC) family protein